MDKTFLIFAVFYYFFSANCEQSYTGDGHSHESFFSTNATEAI